MTLFHEPRLRMHAVRNSSRKRSRSELYSLTRPRLKLNHLVDTDPNAARFLIQKALDLNPGNVRAKQAADLLSERIKAAEATLEEAESAAYRGDIDLASTLLGPLRMFRTVPWEKGLLSFEKADAELERVRKALQLR